MNKQSKEKANAGGGGGGGVGQHNLFGTAVGRRMGIGQVPPGSSEISPVGAVLWADAPGQVLRQTC